MRKLKRAIARANMIRMGMSQLNKKKHKSADGKAHSTFALHWREYVK